MHIIILRTSYLAISALIAVTGYTAPTQTPSVDLTVCNGYTNGQCGGPNHQCHDFRWTPKNYMEGDHRPDASGTQCFFITTTPNQIPHPDPQSLSNIRMCNKKQPGNERSNCKVASECFVNTDGSCDAKGTESIYWDGPETRADEPSVDLTVCNGFDDNYKCGGGYENQCRSFTWTALNGPGGNHRPDVRGTQCFFITDGNAMQVHADPRSAPYLNHIHFCNRRQPMNINGKCTRASECAVTDNNACLANNTESIYWEK